MDIRNQWVSEPGTPERLAEALVRSFFAILVYVVALYAVLVVAEAKTDWFTGLGFLVPLFWLLNWFLPKGVCERP